MIKEICDFITGKAEGKMDEHKTTKSNVLAYDSKYNLYDSVSDTYVTKEVAAKIDRKVDKVIRAKRVVAWKTAIRRR